ncbi:MAG: YdeI/OmpD-associated family protein [Bacteroidota bacterium]
MKFRTVIVTEKKNATGILVPEEVVTGLGAGKKPAVHVTVNGSHTYRSTIATMDGRYLIPLSAENRKAAAVEGGDEADIELSLDTEPREAAIPEDLAEALAANPAARQFFDALSYSGKRVHTLAVEGAKTPETRVRRVEKAIAVLAEGKK